MTISTTPTLALPWPNSDEPVSNGWDAIRDLAVALDSHLATPYWRGKATAIQTIATGNNTGLSLAWQASRGFAGVGSTAPGNAPRTGLYLCTLRVRWAGSAAGTTRKASVWVNNAAVDGMGVVMAPNGNGVLMGMDCVVAATAGQPIAPVVFHDAGVNLDVNLNAADRSAFEVVYVGPQ